MDEAVAALEAARKKKEKEAAMQRWAEEEANRLMRQGQREREAVRAKVAAQEAAWANPSAAVTPPASPEKKPATGINMDKVREEIREQIRKSLFPGLPESLVPGK